MSNEKKADDILSYILLKNIYYDTCIDIVLILILKMKMSAHNKNTPGYSLPF